MQNNAHINDKKPPVVTATGGFFDEQEGKTERKRPCKRQKSAHTVRDLTRDGMRRVESAYRQEAHAGLLHTHRRRSPLPRKGEQGAYTVRVLRCVADLGQSRTPVPTRCVRTRCAFCRVADTGAYEMLPYGRSAYKVRIFIVLRRREEQAPPLPRERTWCALFAQTHSSYSRFCSAPKMRGTQFCGCARCRADWEAEGVIVSREA